MVIAAGVLAMVLLWSRRRSGPPAGQLAGEGFVTTLALTARVSGLMVLAQRLPW
jgi:hypothetical protein